MQPFVGNLPKLKPAVRTSVRKHWKRWKVWKAISAVVWVAVWEQVHHFLGAMMLEHQILEHHLKVMLEEVVEHFQKVVVEKIQRQNRQPNKYN
jgi:hypothetical protein